VKIGNGSILLKLQWGFALSALLILGIMAFYVDRALHRSFELEGTRVLRAQAVVLANRIQLGGPLAEDREARPDRAEWMLLDARGQTMQQSPGLAALPGLAWPDPSEGVREVRVGDQLFSVLSRTWFFPATREGGLFRMALNRSHESLVVQDLRRILFVGWLFTGVVAAWMGRLLAGWGLAPLRRITGEAGNINYRNLDVQLRPEEFPRELAELAETLNRALARLQTSFTRLNQLGSELAHELRTPLQSMRSEVEALLLRHVTTPKTQEALGSVLEECDRMASLIEQVLLLARSDNPGAAITLRWLSAKSFLDTVKEPFEILAEEQNLHIQLLVAEDVHFQADSSLARRAIGNLLSNALKHTPEGGWIMLGADQSLGSSRIWVQDTGMGIPKEWLPRLGERFERGPRRDDAQVEGFGLGLAIVKGIMSLHNGSMLLESTEGLGTKVTLLFPRLD
jgi:two-component system, OmpR family, heavy metal sensor histidine kinase CusS